MPVPPEFERASSEFDAFLVDARDLAGLGSTHQAYTMVQGVLQTFRRRLSVEDAIAFANVLPLLLRALFVTDWDTREARRPFQDRVTMTGEVQSLRADHNFSPPDAIACVAGALRRHLGRSTELDALLARLPAGAAEFWSLAAPLP